MQHEEELDAAPPAWRGQTGLRDRSDRSPGEIGDGLGTLARGGPRQGMRTAVCPRLDRPARAPPHAIETRDEQHIGLEKIRAKRVKR